MSDIRFGNVGECARLTDFRHRPVAPGRGIGSFLANNWMDVYEQLVMSFAGEEDLLHEEATHAIIKGTLRRPTLKRAPPRERKKAT